MTLVLYSKSTDSDMVGKCWELGVVGYGSRRLRRFRQVVCMQGHAPRHTATATIPSHSYYNCYYREGDRDCCRYCYCCSAAACTTETAMAATTATTTITTTATNTTSTTTTTTARLAEKLLAIHVGLCAQGLTVLQHLLPKHGGAPSSASAPDRTIQATTRILQDAPSIHVRSFPIGAVTRISRFLLCFLLRRQLLHRQRCRRFRWRPCGLPTKRKEPALNACGSDQLSRPLRSFSANSGFGTASLR